MASFVAPVRLEVVDDVAVIVIDNPPVNAGSQEVRAGLLDAIGTVASARRLRAAVLIGANGTFIAGSDIREFGQPLQDPQLPEIITAIEACETPIVAALQGAALGGGFELALACDARVIAPGTVVGLPEVTLGTIPGAGGTQRLPRIVGIAKAIDLICSGQRVQAELAMQLHIADALIEGDLRDGAVKFARRLSGKRRLRDASVPLEENATIAAAEQEGLKAAKNRPPAKAAIAAIKTAAALPIDEALRRERAAFQELRMGREAFALRHLFFAEREAAKVREIQNISARTIQRVGVVGAGTMGIGIATCFADAGFDVWLVDRDSATADACLERIRANYERGIASGKLSRVDAVTRIASLRSTADYSALRDVDLAVEAVFEEMPIKQEVFRRLDDVLRADALLATNTSYLDIDALAAVTRRAPQVLGLHFFSPANLMRLIEIVRGAHTDAQTLATAFALAKRLRKIAVLAGNEFGFIGNRIYAAWRRQCELMLEEGALPHEIDAAMEGMGFAMGPFAVADMSGLDIAWRMRQQRAAARDPAARYVEIPDRLCEQGRLGQKTGVGYYRYANGARRGEIDPHVSALIEAARRAKGFMRHTFNVTEIQHRVLMSMVNEAALLLGERVAQRASDIDLVLVNGYGFPKWEGGPIFWAREQSRAFLEAEQERLAAVTGHGFRRGNLELVLNPQA